MVVCGCPNPPCRWELNWAHVPQNVRCDNLYDAALDKTGVSIWAISWTQRRFYQSPLKAQLWRR